MNNITGYEPLDLYPEKKASYTWKWEGLSYSLVWVEGYTIPGGSYNGRWMHPFKRRGHWCGYVRFPKKPLAEEGYSGIATYVPVHGGITYSGDHGEHGFVYGFDCAHYDDENNEDLYDISYLIRECVKMANCIRLARRYEWLYRLTYRVFDWLDNVETDSKIARKLFETVYTMNHKISVGVVQLYANACHKRGATLKVGDNFGVMINILSGRP